MSYHLVVRWIEEFQSQQPIQLGLPEVRSTEYIHSHSKLACCSASPRAL